MNEDVNIPSPPKKWLNILKWFGPGMIFAATSIGTGELILTSRTASLYEWGFLWCVPLIVFCKGISTSLILRYSTSTGQNFLVDIWERKYLKWIVPYFMFSSLLYLTGIGAHIGVTAGTLNLLLPDLVSPQLWIMIVVIIVVIINLLGAFNMLEKFMTALAMIISLGIIIVVTKISLPIDQMLSGLIPHLPQDVSGDVAATTFIGLLGWLGAGWGPTLSYVWWAEEKGIGVYSSEKRLSLSELSIKGVTKIKSWIRIVHLDLFVSYSLTFIVSLCLYIAGATVLYPKNLHPQGILMVESLSNIFTETIGQWAYYLFLVSAFAILLSSIIGVVDGLSRALTKCTAIMWPNVFNKFNEKMLLRLYKIVAIIIPLFFLFLLERPIWLLLLSSMLFAPAIGIIFLIYTYLCLKLPKQLQPHPAIRIITICTSLMLIGTSLWQFVF